MAAAADKKIISNKLTISDKRSRRHNEYNSIIYIYSFSNIFNGSRWEKRNEFENWPVIAVYCRLW